MLRRPRRVFRAGILACVLGGCAHYDELAVGQALTVGDGRRAPALSLEVAEGSGSSSGDGSTFTEARGRLLVSTFRQQVGGLFGVSRLRWLGERAPLWGHVNVGPGVEHLWLHGEHTFFIEAIAHARLGTGFVLAEEFEVMSELNPWGQEAMIRAPGLPAAPKQILRKRALLTLAVAADVDARFTREPLYVASLLLGLAFLEEPRPIPPPALPALF